MRPKVYITRKIPAQAIAMLEPDFTVNSWTHEDDPVPRNVLEDAIAYADGVITLLTDPIDGVLIDQAPNLRIVANMAAGHDNIDVNACTSRGVLVTNTPAVSTESVADLAFGLLLATARRIPEAERVLLGGLWRSWSPMFMAGRDVHDAAIGILGLGRIGEAVARRAEGFRMKILYWDKIRRHDLEESMGVQYRPMHELLKESDFVVVLLPLTEETRSLIGERELRLMKRTAVLVNAGRGPIVDSYALYLALAENWIWGAGLDVYEEEPVDPRDPLVNLPNVVALPHIGSATEAARVAMAMLAVENLIAGVMGWIPPNLVNPEVLNWMPLPGGRKPAYTEPPLPFLRRHATWPSEQRARSSLQAGSPHFIAGGPPHFPTCL